MKFALAPPNSHKNGKVLGTKKARPRASTTNSSKFLRSPAIFGSLFQSVMDKDERRAQGAHYTTEQNILKVIEPLFLDKLCAEFRRLQSRRDSRRIPELIAFQQRLGQLRFFDPACGCGNFLIIAYRELRQLEIEVLKEIRPHGQLDVLAELLSVVDVDQFYGIELGEFPARIADATLADLYDPDLMPADLRRAHHSLDRAVDRTYRRRGFTTERERVEHLFGLYEKVRVPLTAKPRRRR